MEKIWLKNYPPSVPSEINPDEFNSLNEILFEACQKFATKLAFENLNNYLSYQQVWQKSCDFAAYLQHNLQLKKGDRFAIMLPNLLQYPVVFMAALQVGLIITNINPLYTERELLFQLNDSGAETIIILANFSKVLASILPQTQLKNVIVTEVGDLFPSYKRILVASYLKFTKKVAPPLKIRNGLKFRKILKKGKKLKLIPVSVNSEDIALLQYTGGTTGRAKAAVLTHRNLIANILQCTSWIEDILEEGQEIVITALPLYHIFSLICSLAFMKLGGLSVLITNPRDVAHFLRHLKKIPFTVFVGVNTLFYGLLHQSAFKFLNFKSLKLTLAGGMSVLEPVAKAWQEVTKNCVVMGYGLTEASPVVAINPLSANQFTGSAGLAVPSTDVAIRDEAGNNVALGEQGELYVKGPQVMQGYWQKPDETALVLDENGWLRTGDVAKMDEQGYIYLIDRKKDMILVSGFNVYPNEVEEVIATHPGVAEVAVIGIPSTESGESIVAFIVKKDQELTAQRIIRYCKQNLTGYKVPKEIEFRDHLPKSNVGKVLRRKLREELQSHS